MIRDQNKTFIWYTSGEPVGGELEAASADASDTLASDFSFE